MSERGIALLGLSSALSGTVPSILTIGGGVIAVAHDLRSDRDDVVAATAMGFLGVCLGLARWYRRGSTMPSGGTVARRHLLAAAALAGLAAASWLPGTFALIAVGLAHVVFGAGLTVGYVVKPLALNGRLFREEVNQDIQRIAVVVNGTLLLAVGYVTASLGWRPALLLVAGLVAALGCSFRGWREPGRNGPALMLPRTVRRRGARAAVRSAATLVQRPGVPSLLGGGIAAYAARTLLSALVILRLGALGHGPVGVAVVAAAAQIGVAVVLGFWGRHAHATRRVAIIGVLSMGAGIAVFALSATLSGRFAPAVAVLSLGLCEWGLNGVNIAVQSRLQDHGEDVGRLHVIYVGARNAAAFVAGLAVAIAVVRAHDVLVLAAVVTVAAIAIGKLPSTRMVKQVLEAERQAGAPIELLLLRGHDGPAGCLLALGAGAAWQVFALEYGANVEAHVRRGEGPEDVLFGVRLRYRIRRPRVRWTRRRAHRFVRVKLTDQSGRLCGTLTRRGDDELHMASSLAALDTLHRAALTGLRAHMPSLPAATPVRRIVLNGPPGGDTTVVIVRAYRDHSTLPLYGS